MIPLIKTYLPPRDRLMPLLEDVLYSGYIAQGETVDEFEELLGNYIGNYHCISVNSGSSAIHLALILAGVGSNHEVISTPITAEPTNTVIKQTGAKIVWSDIDVATGNICPKSVEEKITPLTKAIVVVDYAGSPVNVPAFQRIEKKYNIPIIQDAAHAFGAGFNNEKLGNHFSYTCFSFQAIKHITTVDGGALFVRTQSDHEKAKLIRWFGLDKKLGRSENNISVQGYKYHMNNVNAAIGIAQLDWLEHSVNRYIKNGKFFDAELKNITGIRLLKHYKGAEPSYWLYTLLVEDKENFIKALCSRGIMVSDLHKRNDMHTLFSEYATALPNVDYFEKNWVHIPCGWWVGAAEREKILTAIKLGW